MTTQHPRAAGDVIVVGAGPVGLLAALDLARRGVAVTVLDKRAVDRPAFGSRALSVSRRSLEMLGRLGIAGPFLDLGVPWSGGRSFYRTTQISSFSMHDPGARYPALVNLQQPFIEDFLVKACAAHPNVTLTWETEVTAVEQDTDGVTVSTAPAALPTDNSKKISASAPGVSASEVGGTDGPSTGATRLRANWVVAADGARSTLRDLLGARLHGRSYANQFVIADIRMVAPHRPAERGCWFDPPAFPGRTVLLHKQPFDIWRIDYQVHGGEDPEELLREEQLLPRIEEHLKSIGEDSPWTLDWSSLYRAHALSLERYRHGRVLFVGDAAHLLPIFGVRGMNSGWADATNLAWKLAAVVAGAADEALLDSFDAEQRDAFAQNRAFAHKSTLFMTPGSPGSTLARDAAVQLAVGDERFSALADPRYSRPTHHVTSALNLPDNGPGWLSGFRPGELVPDVRVSPSSRLAATATGPGGSGPVHLYDVLGPDFAVIVFGAPAVTRPTSPSVTVIRVLPRDRGPDDAATGAGPDEVVIVDADGRLADLFGAEDGDGYVIRPDCYVAARRRAMPASFPGEAVAALLHPPAADGPSAGTGPAAAGEGGPARADGLASPGAPDVPESVPASSLEHAWLRLGEALDRVGDQAGGRAGGAPGEQAAYLARLCLLLAAELDDPARFDDLAAVALANGALASGAPARDNGRRAGPGTASAGDDAEVART